MQARAVGLVAGFAADRLLGDPATGHPVAAFGRFAHDVEQRSLGRRRRAPAPRTRLCWSGGAGVVGAVIAGATRRRPFLAAVTTAAATWAVLGGRSLGREAEAVRDHLAADDLPAARRRLTHLVGRDTEALDEGEISRAVVESVAENTSDAVVAPLLAGAVAGRAGAGRLSRGQHPRRDGRAPQRAVRPVRAGVRAARRPAQPGPVAAVGAARRGARAGRRRRHPTRASTCGAATLRTTRARTPARSRRPSPARSMCGSAASTPTATGWRTGTRSATVDRSSPTTSPDRSAWPSWSARPPWASLLLIAGAAQSAAACGSLTTSTPAGLRAHGGR